MAFPQGTIFSAFHPTYKCPKCWVESLSRENSFEEMRSEVQTKTGVLLVDDHELLRVGLRARLQKEENLEVIADVGSAAEAYAAIERKMPHVVIMDLDLPGEDGISATSKIKTRWPNVRVVALTGSKPASVVQRILLAHADGLVSKAEGAEELVRAIRVVMAKKTFLSPDAATALSIILKAAPAPSSCDVLTDRERTVLKGLAEGQSYKERASSLGISVKSVETYRTRMVKKLGCSTRAELLRCAAKLGLVRC